MAYIDPAWESIKGFKTHEFLVYSAYYDVRKRSEPIIRVIGVTRAKHPEKVTCRIFYDNEKSTSKSKYTQTHSNLTKGIELLVPFLDVHGAVSLLDLGFSKDKPYYHPCYIICPLNHTKFTNFKNLPIPVSVSIAPMSSTNLSLTKKFQVINAKNGGTGTYSAPKNDIALCVKPIHTNYNNWVELFSFIELNKILGVSKIIVYNESMSKDISCVLEYYSTQEHFISVLAWDLFEKSNISTDRMRNRGVQSSLNDCFYRNMNEYKYIFSVDLDEFIIPHMHETIPEMLEYLTSADINFLDSHWRQKKAMKNVQNVSNPNVITSYNFKNALFYQHYGKRYFLCMVSEFITSRHKKY